MNSYLFIDIRKSDEVYKKRFDYSNNYKFYNIPMNMIKFNIKTIIDHLNYIDEIYIVCNSAKRANFIKNKYFLKESKIKVNNNLQFKNFKYGNNIIELNKFNNININIIGNKGYNYYSILRIVQTLLGSLILILGGYTLYIINKYKNINNIPLIILILFGLMALINGITSTCTISKILENYLN